MGKLLEFSINFAGNQQAIFQPGQIISGTVVINLNDSMKMRAVRLKFQGKSYVAFKQKEKLNYRSRQRSSRKTQTRRFRASETYFSKTLFLAGEGTDGFNQNASHLPAGRTDLPFTFQLPPNLPTSFKGRHGYVHYFVKATIDKPWKFDHDTTVGFTVLNSLDLNEEPTSKNPVESSNSKTFCCWCCASGPLQIEMRIDRAGYVPGEFIFVNANIENFSSRDVPSIKAEMIQTVVYHAQGRTKTVGKAVASIIKEGCPAKKIVTWNNEQMQIPPVATSKLDHCKIIDLSYNVVLTALPPSGSFALQAYVPIIIGSIPLKDLTPFNHPNPAVIFQNPTAPQPAQHTVISSVPSAPPAPPTNLSSFQPPPSFAQAFQDPGAVSDDETNDMKSFSPQYAYYDWSQSGFSYS